MNKKLKIGLWIIVIYSAAWLALFTYGGSRYPVIGPWVSANLFFLPVLPFALAWSYVIYCFRHSRLAVKVGLLAFAAYSLAWAVTVSAVEYAIYRSIDIYYWFGDMVRWAFGNENLAWVPLFNAFAFIGCAIYLYTHRTKDSKHAPSSAAFSI